MISVAVIAGTENLWIHRQKTCAAIDGAPLRWIKRNGRVFIALGAVNGDLDFLFDTGSLRRHHCFDAIIFGLFTRLASFGRVLQSFIPKEYLLADSPDKIFAAIVADDHFIFQIFCRVFYRGIT